jgi:hypothetical protein
MQGENNNLKFGFIRKNWRKQFHKIDSSGQLNQEILMDLPGAVESGETDVKR